MQNSCPYVPRKVLTEKQAKKQPVGSFYHPTEKTYRSGACPIGYNLRKGYHKKGYIKKDGKIVKNTNVDPICIKNKGSPGKLLSEFKTIVINEKNSFKPYGYSTSNNSNSRFKSLLEAVKVLSYKTVLRKLVALRTYHKNSNNEVNIKLFNIFDIDIHMLQKWRYENPDLYKTKLIKEESKKDNKKV